MIRKIPLFPILIPLLLCVLALEACSKTQIAEPAVVARQFVVSLNQHDTTTLQKLSASPLLVRQQDWQSAPDGTGFVLGKITDTRLIDRDQIREFFTDPRNNIAVESEVPDSASLELFTDELKGMEQHWAGLSLQLFRRGMGDVEHIFVVGVNNHGKVAALYFN